MFDMTLNQEVEKWVINKVNSASSENLTGDALQRFLEQLRADTNLALECARNSEDTVRSWYLYRAAYARYGFVETVVEASVFSEAKLASLMLALGENPLAKLAEVDRLNPSQLTNFEFSHEMAESRSVDSETVEDYLILKKWQDDQNRYHYDVIFPEFRQARISFDSWRSEHAPRFDELGARDALAAVLLAWQGFQSIDYAARLSLAHINQSLVKVVGGKALGLCQIITSGRFVPEVWVVPVLSAAINISTPDDSHSSWAVRSSATVEDGEKTSFAGIFASELEVPSDKLNEAVCRVRDSVDSARARAYVEHFKTDTPSMAVLVQKFRAPAYAGVWMGRSLESGRLEWVAGSGDGLVSGKITPHAEDWSTPSGVHSPISAQGFTVGESCLQFQRELDVVADLEWAIVDDELVWLQYRPVTKIVAETTVSSDVHGGSRLVGVAASGGKATGTVIVMDSPEGDEWIDGSILVTAATDPDWVPIMLKSAAVVTAEGGALSHAAIIAREIGIPCVTCVRGALEIQSGATIMVDGNAGVVTLRS